MFDPKKQDDPDSGPMIWSNRRPRQPGDPYEPASEIDNDQLSPVSDDAKQAMEVFDKTKPGKKFNLDSPEAIQIHDRLLSMFTHELDRQNTNRAEMAADDDMFDHMHYSDEDLAAYAARGQTPVVYNITQTTVNWVLGTQRRSPMDYKILPRTPEGAKAAEAKTELLKHVSDTNRSEYEHSLAFAASVRVGLGWIESGQGLPHEGTQVFDRYEDWRFMLWDSTAKRYDLQDARYLFRAKWLDVDVAEAMWSNRKGLIRASLNGTLLGLYGTDDLGDDPMDSQETAHLDISSRSTRGFSNWSRDRVRVIEAWFKRATPKAPFMRGGQFHGELFDPWSVGHIKDLNMGAATISAAPAELTYVALMTERGMLYMGRSPFRHNRFPFTPVWGYRRQRDGMPYGLIRGVRSIQQSFNKQKSKALHHLSATRTFVEEGAVDDIDELANEVGRPDSVIVYKPGRQRPDVVDGTKLADAHLKMAAEDASLLQATAGVTDENMGRRTNAVSGIAIERRQNQGALATSLFFDNLRQSRLIHGEKLMVLIEQFYTEKDTLRILDPRGKPKWMPINDNEQDAIGAHKADFIINEEEWRATVRQANAELLVELAMKIAPVAPEVVVKMLDIIVEAMDLPRKDELVQRIRQLTGVEDPDADPNNPTPEQQAKKEMEALEGKMMIDAAQAELEEKQGKARKINAEATAAERKIGDDSIARLKSALEAAIQIAGYPMVAQAADAVLQQAMAAEAEAFGDPMPAPGAAPFVDPMAMPPASQPMPQPPMPPVDPAMQQPQPAPVM
jgi:hypothetical protein